MTKTIISLMLCSVLAAFASIDSKPELRVVPMSKAQWQSVQDQVNTNGYCRIEAQNVVLVLTNGCQTVVERLPMHLEKHEEVDALDRNKLKAAGRRGKPMHYMEPTPYVGQGR